MEAVFDRMFRVYEWSVGVVLRHRVVMFVVFFAVLAGTVEMFILVPKGFIPDQDNDSLNINLRAAQGTSFYEMANYAKQVADVVYKNPNIDAMMVSAGGMGGPGGNNARFDVQLTPRKDRQVPAQQIARQI